MTVEDLHVLTGRLIEAGHGDCVIVDGNGQTEYVNELCSLEPVTLVAIFDNDFSYYRPHRIDAYQMVVDASVGYTTRPGA